MKSISPLALTIALLTSPVLAAEPTAGAILERMGEPGGAGRRSDP